MLAHQKMTIVEAYLKQLKRARKIVITRLDMGPKRNGTGNVIIFVLPKKHHLYPPFKPTQGFRGFRYYHTIYVQLSVPSKVLWQLDQLSIIDSISWKASFSNIRGACMIYRIQVWQICFFVTLNIFEYIIFELPNHSLLRGSAWSLLGKCCCCTLEKY